MGQNFSFTIGGQDAGGSQAFDQVSGAGRRAESVLDSFLNKANKVESHPGFDKFADQVKRGIEEPLGTAGDAIDNVLKKLGPMGSALGAGVGIFTAIGAAGFSAAKGLGEYSDRLGDTSKRLGSTIQETYNLDFAMKRAGGTLEAFEIIERKLSQTMSDTSEEGKKGREELANLGVTVYDLTTGKMRPLTDVALDLSEALGSIQETAKRNDVALRIFGRGTLAVLPDLLELTDGIRRARELGLSPSDADIARWDGYHKQISEAESRWDALARKLKEPLAGFVTVIMRGGDSSDIGRMAADSIKGQIGKTDEATLRGRLDKLKSSGFGEGSTVEEIEKAIDLYFTRAGLKGGGAAGGITIDQSRLTRALAPISGEKGELEGAQKRLSELQEQLRSKQQLGAPYDERAGVAALIEAQKASVIAIQAHIEKLQELKEAEQALQAFEKEMADKSLSPVSAIFHQRDELVKRGADKERADSAALAAADTIVAKGEAEVFDKYSKLIIKHFEDSDKAITEATQNAGDAAMAMVDQFILANSRVEAIRLQAAGTRAVATSRARVGAAALAAGPGQELGVAQYEMAERLRLAEQLHNLAVAEANLQQDAGKRREMYAAAYWNAENERYQAALDYENRVAELQRRRLDELRNVSGQFFDALTQRRLGDFFKGLAKGWARTMFENMAVELLQGQSGHLSLPGQGSAQNPNLLGKVLRGTPFGIDPLKDAAGMKLSAAGMELSMAAGELMVAARSIAMSGSGGGGGYSSAASTFERLAGGDGEEDLGYVGSVANGGGGGGWKSALKYGGAAVAGGIGIYSGVRSGGARGALTATGSALAATGAILSMASKALKIAGPIGEIAGIGLGLLTMALPDPKLVRDRQENERLAAARYEGPVASSYVRDRYGRSYDSDVSGAVRPWIGELHVHAMDTQGVLDRADDIATALVVKLESRTSPRLSSALRNAVRG